MCNKETGSEMTMYSTEEGTRVKEVFVLEHNGMSHPFKEHILRNRVQQLAKNHPSLKWRMSIDALL